MTATLATASVVTLACWCPASRQALDDNVSLADFVNSTLLDALAIAEDDALLNGPGTTGHMSGLLTRATAYSRTLTGDAPNDTVRRMTTQVALAGGVPNGIVVSPIGLELLELEKDMQGRYILTLTVDDVTGASLVWRVNVVSSLGMAANDVLCGDFVRSCPDLRSPASRRRDRHEPRRFLDTQFARNSR